MAIASITHRLIPSQYPPIGLFDTVSTAADLKAVMELAGWTNDRLLAERLARLPRSEWVFGRANSSIVMAAFLHVAPGGSRFNGPDLGAWYAGGDLATSVAEVGHHLRRETIDRGLERQVRTFRAYSARLAGTFETIARRADREALLSPVSYRESQSFGESVREAGGDGLAYPSVRYAGGTCFCAYRPSKVVDVIQAEHFAITVAAAERRIEAKLLTSAQKARDRSRASNFSG